jgi:hypothetical protein
MGVSQGRMGASMNRGRSLKATFSDGSFDYMSGAKAFTHAWRITGILGTTKASEINGWARSKALAEQAATHHARSVAKRWKNVKTEIVEVETLA